MLDFATTRNALVAAVLVSAAALGGCNSDEAKTVSKTTPGTSPSTSATTTTTNTSTTSGTLSIAGTSANTVRVGENYNFQPNVSGSAATGAGFSIQNKPAWATFNTATGALTGTPGAASVGTYANIVISASGTGGASAALAAFSLSVTAVTASTGSATLSWTPPTQNTDGSSIANLAGYKIYYGSSEGALTSSINVTNPGLTAYTVADLKSGTTYFGITAYTSGGVESSMSNIGSKTIM